MLNKEAVLSIIKKRKEINSDGTLKTNKQIAKELGVSATTISRWCERLRKSGRDVPKKKGGRPSIILEDL